MGHFKSEMWALGTQTETFLARLISIAMFLGSFFLRFDIQNVRSPLQTTPRSAMLLTLITYETITLQNWGATPRSPVQIFGQVEFVSLPSTNNEVHYARDFSALVAADWYRIRTTFPAGSPGITGATNIITEFGKLDETDFYRLRGQQGLTPKVFKMIDGKMVLTNSSRSATEQHVRHVLSLTPSEMPDIGHDGLLATWFSFASGSYFQKKEKTAELFYDGKWIEGAKPEAPVRITLEEKYANRVLKVAWPATDYVFVAKGEFVDRAQKPRHFTFDNIVFEVLSVTNVGGLIWPAVAKLEVVGFADGSLATPVTLYRWTVRTKEILPAVQNTKPELDLPKPLFIADYRLARVKDTLNVVGYTSTNANVLTIGELRKTKAYQSHLDAFAHVKTQGTVRYVTLFLLGVLISLPILRLVLKTKRKQ